MNFTTLSPCKLNLFLYITGKRADNYHNLQTLFVILDHGDTMSFDIDKCQNYINDFESLIDIEGPFDFDKKKNLIYKAAVLFFEHFNIRFRVKVKIDKVLPEGAGLGGGSSNAATVLLVLNKLCNVNASQEELIKLGAKLGADVPIFILGTPAFAQGVGDILKSVDVDSKYYLVVTPKCHVATKDIFQDPNLKRDSQIRDFQTLLKLGYHNDFTQTVVNNYALVGQCLNELVKYGPAYMSGSGSSCFVEFDNLEKAQMALLDLDKSAYRSAFVAKSCKTSSTVLDLY